MQTRGLQENLAAQAVIRQARAQKRKTAIDKIMQMASERRAEAEAQSGVGGGYAALLGTTGPAPVAPVKQATPAKPHHPGDGYDHSGGKGLNPEFMSRLNKMLAEAPGKVKLNSGYRSAERQAKLYQDAIKKYGSEKAARKWVAPPGKSNHGRGIAYDLGFADNNTRQWFHQNAAKYGLKFPMSHEPWHIELA